MSAACLLAVFLHVQTATATNPNLISFQGKVVNANGTNVADGSYNFDFVMYDDITLGTPSDGVHDKWHELSKSVTVTNGIFQTNLGSATALPDFNANPSLYLAIRFNGDAAGYMSPRVQMASVPYALNADKVGGVAASGLVQLGASQSGNINIGTGTITSGNINGQTISSSANFTGNITLQGGTATLGTTSQAGTLVLSDGSSNTVSLVASGIGTNYSLTLPTAAGSTSQCLQTDSVTASQLVFSSCGSGGGDSITVNGSVATDANFLNTTATASVAGTTFTLNTIANPDTITLTISDASGTVSGVVTANAQTFGGVKTFNDNIILAAQKTVTLTGSTTANRPSGTEGQMYYDTDTDKLLIYSNGKWQADRSDAIIVAASDSTQLMKDKADYVANGDGGSAGDGDQVQINAALTEAGNGGTVYLAPGTYTVDASIVMSGLRQTLRGSGAASLVYLNTPNATDNLIDAGSNNSIEYLSLNGQSGNSSSGTQYGVVPTGALTLRTVGFIDFRSASISLASVSSVKIYDINSEGTTNDIIISGTSSNIYIDTSTFYGAYDSIYATGTLTDLTVVNSHFEAEASSSINLSSSSISEVKILNNRMIDGNDAPVRSIGSKVTISGNNISGYNGAISISSSSYNTIENNIISSLNNAVDLLSSTYNIVANNQFRDTGGATASNAIYLSASDYNTIIGNVVTDPSCTTTCYGINISDSTSDFNYVADNRLGATAGTNQMTINDAGTNTRYAAQLTPAQILQSGSSYIKANATSVLTGTIDPAASTAVVGVGTKFLTELQVGDRITVTGETRTVTAITDNLNLTVDVAFSNNANDTSPDRLPAAFRVTNSSGTTQVVVKDDGSFNVWGGTAVLGTPTQSGTLTLSDGSSNTVSLVASGIGTNYSLTLPTAAGSTSQCLQTDSVTASQLIFGSCGSGGGSDLQTAYATDSNGSDVTISLSATDGSLIFDNPTSSGTGSAFTLKVSQSNTTAAVSVLDLIQSSNAANAVNLTANAIDTETALAITANVLTSGKGLSLTSSATAFTGNLMDISLTGSNASNTGSVLAVSNTGVLNNGTTLLVEHQANGTGSFAFRVNDVASDTTPFVIDSEGKVGIGTTTPREALQVGSVTNRQDSLFYGDVTKAGIIDKTSLANINDVFVYDTTRDVDAGKWTRTRTAQTSSWYNETVDNTAANCVIATDDRCGQTSFPKKAILAVTPDALYIFDSDDNSMWMKFTQGGTYALGADTNNNPSSVFALNGVIYVGTNGTASTGLYAIDFVQDILYRYNTTDRNQGDKNIGNRNTAVTYNVSSTTGLKFIGTASVQVNDVSAVVLSGGSSVLTNGGPLNGATFICAATDDAVQVINLSSGITIPFGAALTDQYSACSLTRRGRLYALNVTKQQLERYGNPATSGNNIDTTTVAPATGVTSPYKVWDESATAANAPNLFKTAQTFNVKPDTLEVIERGSQAESVATGNGDLIYVGHGGGLTEIHDLDTNASPALGWSKYYTINGETGYMVGTPRGYFNFNEATGATQATDATVRNNVLAIKSGVTMGVANGVHNMAARFDGTSGYMCSDANADGTCDQDTDFDPTSSTVSYGISLWFRHNGAVTGTDTLVDRSGNSTVAGFIVTMNSSGQVVAVQRDGTITDTLTSTQSFADSQWHNLEIVRNNGSALFCMFIDGRLAVTCDTATTTATLNGATAMAIGATCTGTVTTCSTPTNFWDGDIDDVYFHMGGATTADQLTQTQVRRRYLEGRAAMLRPSTIMTDATTATSTTIGDSSAAWVPNSFTGSFVEITGGTGAGQTRRIVSNTSTVFTVSPAFSVTPDTTSDFEVQPQQLYGSTNSVYAIGTTDNSFLGDNRKLYIGTNDGADGGGVTQFEGNGTSYATELYHADAGLSDESGLAWSGTDADDIQSIGTNGTSVVMASLAHFWTETDELDFQVTLDTLANRIFTIRSELLVDGITGTSSEIGALGGADLAENYVSNDELIPGQIVSMLKNTPGHIQKTVKAYDDTMLGIVATAPGLVLGGSEENSYPVALVGRVPVLVTTENGDIKTGDRVTSSSVAGYGMKAVQAGRVLGTALDDLTPEKYVACPEGTKEGVKCGQITVFVNLVDYNGQKVDLAIGDAFEESENIWDPIAGMYSDVSILDGLTTSSKILRYLAGRQEQLNGKNESEILTDRLSTVTVNANNTYSQNGYSVNFAVDRLKANKIEGLELLTVNGNAEFKGNTLFKGLVTFVEKTVFNNDISFNGRTTFNNDTAGFAVIKAGQKDVKVTFDRPYEQLPVVTVTIKNGKFEQFTYTDLTPEGFTIALKDPAVADVEFAWTSLSIKDVKTAQTQ